MNLFNINNLLPKPTAPPLNKADAALKAACEVGDTTSVLRALAEGM